MIIFATMKKLLAVILLALVLVAAVTGCGGAHRYDSRLTAADSLMQPNPDSALAIVEAIVLDSLPDEGNRAYRDLLLTQARYRCYVTATSDSNINRALNYYRAHNGEREKLTRAYIYKGAVMDELGHPDSAMLYYKHAEATAAPDDYFNLGYTKMRIATLYQDQLSQDSAAIIRLKDAIRYFELINDTNYLISCYGKLGAICGVQYPDSTEYYLSHAIELAQQFNPTKQYTYKSKLAGFNLFYKHDYKTANRLSMDVLKNGSEYSDESQFYYYAVLSFINLNLIDSAKHILSIIPDPIDAVDSMLYHDVIALIARYENEPETFASSISDKMNLTTRFFKNLQEEKLITSEKEFDRLQVLNEKENAVRKNVSLKTILYLAVVILLILVIAVLKQRDSLQRHLKEKEQIKNELEKTLEELEKERQLYKQNETVSQLVTFRISALKELYQDVRVKTSDNTKTKRIVPLAWFLKEMNERNELMQVSPSASFWKKMKLSIDGEFNGIASYVEQHYPQLSDGDLKLFYLLCANLSPQIIKLCLNYQNAKTVSNYRKKLINQKMGLGMSLDEFIQQYLEGKIS